MYTQSVHPLHLLSLLGDLPMSYAPRKGSLRKLSTINASGRKPSIDAIRKFSSGRAASPDPFGGPRKHSLSELLQQEGPRRPSAAVSQAVASAARKSSMRKGSRKDSSRKDSSVTFAPGDDLEELAAIHGGELHPDIMAQLGPGGSSRGRTLSADAQQEYVPSKAIQAARKSSRRSSRKGSARKHSVKTEFRNPYLMEEEDARLSVQELLAGAQALASQRKVPEFLEVILRKSGGEGYGIHLLQQSAGEITIEQVAAGSVAAANNVRVGDVVLEVNGIIVQNLPEDSMGNLLRNLQGGDRAPPVLHMKLHRNGTAGGSAVAAADGGGAFAVTLRRDDNGLGLVIDHSEVTLGDGAPGNRIWIDRVIANTPAARCGRLLAGDCIEAINGTAIKVRAAGPRGCVARPLPLPALRRDERRAFEVATRVDGGDEL
jgi:hypothetical protein